MDSDNQGQRLFIGLPVSMRSLRALSNAAADLKVRLGEEAEGRWVAPARYHLTLRYLGWTRPDAVPALIDEVASAIKGVKPFGFRLREIGGFPSLEEVRVLWAGVEESAAAPLGDLQKRVAGAADKLGFAAPDQGFHPHVTLARFAEPFHAVKLAQAAPEHVFSKSSVDSLILYKSSVESGSYDYERVHIWPIE